MTKLKDLLQGAKDRESAVMRRITAIEKELVELREEQNNLSALIELYEHKEYDSIEEEKRVTDKVLKKKCDQTDDRELVDNFLEVYLKVQDHELTVSEALRKLGVSKTTYYSMVKRCNS